MQDGAHDAATASCLGGSAIHQNSAEGKLTLSINCIELLKPDINRPGVYGSKSAEEAAEGLQLRTLLPVPILHHIKVKLFHSCGPIEFDEGSCLTALWSVGDWLVEQYREIGKSARYERSNRGRGDDWIEPDATLNVFIA